MDHLESNNGANPSSILYYKYKRLKQEAVKFGKIQLKLKKKDCKNDSGGMKYNNCNL